MLCVQASAALEDRLEDSVFFINDRDFIAGGGGEFCQSRHEFHVTVCRASRKERFAGFPFDPERAVHRDREFHVGGFYGRDGDGIRFLRTVSSPDLEWSRTFCVRHGAAVFKFEAWSTDCLGCFLFAVCCIRFCVRLGICAFLIGIAFCRFSVRILCFYGWNRSSFRIGRDRPRNARIVHERPHAVAVLRDPREGLAESQREFQFLGRTDLELERRHVYCDFGARLPGLVAVDRQFRGRRSAASEDGFADRIDFCECFVRFRDQIRGIICQKVESGIRLREEENA